MKRVLLVLLALVLLLGVTACDKDKTEEYSSLYGYATNPLVDRFAEDYATGGAIAMEDMTPIAGGQNIAATMNGVQVTIFTDRNNLFCSLVGGMTEANRDEMMSVFKSLATVADPTVTAEDMTAVIDHLKQQEKLVLSHKVGGVTMVETYSPAVASGEMSTGCRLTFYVKGYGDKLENNK